MADAAPTEDKKTAVKIKYTGSTVHTRVLTAKDFKDAGFDGVKNQEWSLANNHTVDASDWPKDAVEFVTGQPDFKTV